jgi:adenylate cyclase
MVPAIPPDACEVALLLADITGSTPLFERIGEAAAVRQIGECLERLKAIAGREGGQFIRSRGDDVLCTFADSCSALRAARAMLASCAAGPLAIHAGGHFGHIIQTSTDLFGDAVNLTARLAGLAKPGELLVSRGFVDRLERGEGSFFRLLDDVTFKGRHAPTEVYSLLEDSRTTTTEIVLGIRSHGRQPLPSVSVTLRYREGAHQCRDQQVLSIGRSPDCDIVIEQLWVSRKHATLAVSHGKVQLEDRSASGTYVTMGNGQELFMHRDIALLTGSGTISPAVRPNDEGAEVLYYQILRGEQEIPN